MEVVAEGQEEWGNEHYEELFRRILVDLGITRLVEEARMIIRPKDPLFLVSIRTKRTSGKRKITDIASLRETSKGTVVEISDENYAPRLISLLWQLYGRERVDQQSRLELVIRGESEEEIQKLTMDPEEELKEKVLDAVWRLLPEGFKVRHNIYSEGLLTIAATEHEMRQEWKEEAERVHREMEGD
ncbi:MAG: methanogenesis marker 17 protein [Methanomassiliicoccales archaeon]